MVDEEDACDAAIMAALDLMNEKCEERGGEAVLLNEDTAIFIPEEAVEEIGYSPHSPETPEQREEAIEKCIGSEWATQWSNSVVGASAPADVKKAAQRELCEGLFSD